MGSAISENKRSILLDLIRKLEDEISELYHEIEDDAHIPNDRFKEYEKELDHLLSTLKEIKTEVYYT
jgi:hypothetical protein